MKKKNISLLLVTLLVMLSSCSEFYSDCLLYTSDAADEL